MHASPTRPGPCGFLGPVPARVSDHRIRGPSWLCSRSTRRADGPTDPCQRTGHGSLGPSCSRGQVEISSLPPLAVYRTVGRYTNSGGTLGFGSQWDRAPAHASCRVMSPPQFAFAARGGAGSTVLPVVGPATSILTPVRGSLDPLDYRLIPATRVGSVSLADSLAGSLATLGFRQFAQDPLPHGQGNGPPEGAYTASPASPCSSSF